jgi:branched-subunit amino acid aminotransferase/4-amino-4-deoxychorismate lyase
VNRKSPGSLSKAWRWNGRSIIRCGGGVSLTDRGFRYGQHLFESIAIRNGQPLLWIRHLELLAESAKRNRFPFPRRILSALKYFVKSISLPDGMLRIFLTAGDGGPCSPINSPECYLLWEPAFFPTENDINKGYHVTSDTEPFFGDFWGEKSGNYASHLKRFGAARIKGFDEGIIFDAEGYLLSCCMGNLIVWMKKGGEVLPFIPPETRGARSGAVLDWVRKKINVTERDLRLSDIRRAVGFAVTNSRLGVMPVSELDAVGLRDPSLSQLLARSYMKDHGL